MIELGRVREKLEAIRNKCQPYPEWEDDALAVPIERPPPSHAFEQVKAELAFLRNKVAELQKKKRRKRGEY